MNLFRHTDPGKQKPACPGSRRSFAAAFLLFLADMLLMAAASLIPGAAEWYWNTLYRPTASAVSRLTGRIPFSLAEFGLYLLILLFLFSLVRLGVQIRKHRAPGKVLFLWSSHLLLAASILGFFFMLGGGINYHQTSFAEKAGISVEPVSTEDLQKICLWLTDEVNARCTLVNRDSDGVMQLSRPEGPDGAAAMEKLGETWPDLSGFYPMPKKVCGSVILSQLGLTGIFSAFTIEANYNGDMTPYNIPFTVCHELSHLKGFMQEEEANFIAFLACIGSGQTDFEYSGYLSAWIYCMNALYDTDYELWKAVRSVLSPLAEPDLSANNAFWNSYESTLSEVSDQVNDTYLKLNGQEQGVQSYDRMVELVVAFFKDKIPAEQP